MSLAIYDFSDYRNIRIFWVTIAICLLLFLGSATFLYIQYKNKKDLEDQFHLDNEAAIFVAPPGILDPESKFGLLGSYEDKLPKEEELPAAVAPEDILDPSWNAKFTKPSQIELSR